MLWAFGAREDIPIANHHTALFAAVHFREPNLIGALIESGSDLFQYASEGLRTLLYAAARMKYWEIVQQLLSYGLHPDFVGGDHRTPQCCYYNENEQIPLTPLTAAVKNEDLFSAVLLLRAGANPNRLSLKFSPLQMAKTVEMADLLLSFGADIQLNSPLTQAVKTGSEELVVHLIQAGANLHIPDADGKLPLDYLKIRFPHLVEEVYPKLSPPQILVHFLTHYLEPELQRRGYIFENGAWRCARGDFSVVIQIHNFPWIKESFNFCFQIGFQNTTNSLLVPETAYMQRKHLYKRNIGYRINEPTTVSPFIRELRTDFETEIFPKIDSFTTWEAVAQFFDFSY